MEHTQTLPFTGSYSDLEPWLKPLYLQLQSAWQDQRLAQTLCLSYAAKAEAEHLLQRLIAFLFCQSPKPIPSVLTAKEACQSCHACRLLQAQTHPDLHVIACLKEKKLIAIDQIRSLQNKVYEQSQQGGLRLIWIQEAELLSEAAANALLKMVEEPPKNCYFIFSIHQSVALMPTLKSRSVCFQLQNPTFENGLEWIQAKWQKWPKFHLDPNRSHQFETALLLSQNEPAQAFDLLRSTLWQQRAVFYQKLQKGLVEKNLWRLRSFLSDSKQTLFFVHCVQTLFADAFKAKNKAGAFIVNRDFAALVRALLSYDLAQLDQVFKLWQQAEIELNTILGLNQELIVAELFARSEGILFDLLPEKQSFVVNH